LAPKRSFWRKIDYSLVVSILSALFTGAFAGATFWENFFPHRAVLLTIATPRPSGMLYPVGQFQTFDLTAIIANAGNRTEVLPSICIAASPSVPSNLQRQGSAAGPYLLKAGDAITVALKLSFDEIRLVGTGNEKDVYVHVVAISKDAISKDNDLMAADFPISHLTYSQKEGENTYTERQAAGYNPGLTDILSARRSKFASCKEGVSAVTTLTILPSKK
jgi:hypothetical protein